MERGKTSQPCHLPSPESGGDGGGGVSGDGGVGGDGGGGGDGGVR